MQIHKKKMKNKGMYKIKTEKSNLLVGPEHKVYVEVKEKAQSSFLFLRSDQSKESLTSNSLNFVSILSNSANTPPSSISVIGGEPMIPSHFNMITNTPNAINPQAIIPNILSSVSLFIYQPYLFIISPMTTPEIIPINTLNPTLNFNNRLNTAVTSTTTAAPLKIVLYSFDNIDKSYLDSYIKLLVSDIPNYKLVPNHIILVKRGNLIVWSGNSNFTSLAQGTHSFKAYAQDIAGNVNKTETRTIKIMTAPSANRFRITDSSGTNIASIDNQGNIYLKRTASQSQSSLNPTPYSFIVQNSSMNVIAYINSTGYLFLKGTITENPDLTGMTNTNLEFRNSSDNIIAFFDNGGNLKLKGTLGENYANP